MRMCVSCVRGYDLGPAPLKRTCDVCRKIPAVHKSGSSEVRMRSMIVAVLSLFMTTAVLAQWEPPNAPHVPDNGGPPRVYFAHSYFKEAPRRAGLDDRLSIHVQNFGTLLKQANGNCQGIVLFIEG